LFQYPAWLEENQPKLEPSEFERFKKQKVLMDRVCAELQKESGSESQEEKKRRFDTVLDLMQKVRWRCVVGFSKLTVPTL
jgi:peroxin-19